MHFIFMIEFAMQNVGLGKANFAMNLFFGNKTKQPQKKLQRNFHPEI